MENKKLMRVFQASEALTLSEATLRAWIASRRIGYVRLGRRAIRIPMAEIEKILAVGAVPAREGRHARG